MKITPVRQPEFGTVVLNADGTFTYTPNPGFHVPDSFVYEICDPSGGTSQATVFINVNYGQTTFTNPVDVGRSSTRQAMPTSRPLLSRTIQTLAPNPIFSGHARPGTVVTGRIYDSVGNLVGQASSRTDPGGNWMMQFQGMQTPEDYRVEFEQTVELSDMYGYLGYNLHGTHYQSMQTSGMNTPGSSVARAMETSAHEMSARFHDEVHDSIGFGERE